LSGLPIISVLIFIVFCFEVSSYSPLENIHQPEELVYHENIETSSMSAALAKKVVIITGGNTGIGLETAKQLSKMGMHTIIGCRSKEKGEAAVTEIKNFSKSDSVEYLPLDLADFKSVRAFANAFLQKHIPLDVLINNAGIMAVPLEKTVDGYESQFQVNHLSHFLLTHLLLDSLRSSAPSRIINVSSKAHLRWQSPIDYDVLKNESPKTYDAWKAYGRSKLANILFTYELNKRLRQISSYQGVSVNTLHPGLVDTQLLTKAGFLEVL